MASLDRVSEEVEIQTISPRDRGAIFPASGLPMPDRWCYIKHERKLFRLLPSMPLHRFKPRMAHVWWPEHACL